MELIYAQIDDANAVIGVSRVSTLIDAAHMIRIERYDVSLLGRTYNKETGEFEDAPPDSSPAPERRITVLAARQRLGDDLETLDLFGLPDAADDEPTRRARARVRRFLGDLAAATYVDLDDPRIMAALSMFVDAELIAPDRPEQILGDDPQPDEMLWAGR